MDQEVRNQKGKEMKELHKAALVRAYRTLAQGLGGSAVATAFAAVITGGTAAVPVALGAVGAVIVSAVISFWQGVAQGLPEAE